MQLQRLTALLLWAVPAMLVYATSATAAGPSGADRNGGGVAADLYLSPAPESGLNVPSGAINISPNQLKDNSTVSNSFTVPSKTAYTDADVTNLQGCGGVGQGEFTSGLYNMPESFTKFSADANSVLARQLVTINYTMPQTAALFDQLNNFGAERYAAFQRGCNLDALKQDARKQYLDACVAKIMPARVTSLSTITTGDGKKIVEPQLSAMAYAQSWEVCSNQYVSDTAANTVRKEVNKAFAEKMRSVEDVNATIKPLLCTIDKDDTEGSGCWISYLIPQVRVCYDAGQPKACEGDNAYGVKEPLVSMQRLFDIYRFALEDQLVSRRVIPLQQQIKNFGVDANMQHLAAGEAALLLSTATITRTSGSGTAGAVSRIELLPDESVLDFQVNYLSCKNPDPLNPLLKFKDRLQKRMDKAKLKGGDGKLAALSLPVVAENTSLFDAMVKDQVKLPSTGATNDQDVLAFTKMLDVSFGCTLNQNVPMLDPNLTVSVNQCTTPDQYAFYTMAGYDVSLAATRDVYRYVNLRLKQAYTTLLSQNRVPSPTTTTGGTTTATSPTLSPEINSRLATVVKESMIPYIESQIERLDEIDRTRGKFSQRVQQIYADRGGCISSASPALQNTGGRAWKPRASNP